MAKLRKIYRPEIEVEYKNIFGVLYAFLCILKVGIKKAMVEYKAGSLTLGKQKIIIIPKYTFKKAVED